jgi:hypothetical protein
VLDDTNYSQTNGHDTEDGFEPIMDVEALELELDRTHDEIKRLKAIAKWTAAMKSDGWWTDDIQAAAVDVGKRRGISRKNIVSAVDRGCDIWVDANTKDSDFSSDCIMKEARKALDERLSRPIAMLEENEPEAGMTAALDTSVLDDVYAFLGRFIVFPSTAAHVATALWVLHAHLMSVWETTPRLAVLSAEWGSGKSRLLEVIMTLVPAPIWAVNVTANYLFRKIGEGSEEEQPPTILYDEIDTVFGPKAKGDHEDTRAILNAGYHKGAVAGRCVVNGQKVGTEEIPAYSAVALAGIGDLPDTIMSRSVIIRMKKRAPNERVESWRQRIHTKEGKAIRDHIEIWAENVRDHHIVWPDLPPGIEDRQADIWEPLIVVADIVGGDWPQRARDAAVFLVSQFRGRGESLGVWLLRDIQSVFPAGAASIGTKSLLVLLHNLDESPWGELKGKPLHDRGLAKLLKEYGIESKQIRVGEWTGKGYLREHFHDAWNRYVSDPVKSAETESETDLAKGAKHAKQGNTGAING